MAKRKPKTPFAMDDDGRKYVQADAIMHPLIPAVDGLTVTMWEGDKHVYLNLDEAIRWVQAEMQFHSREKYEQILAVLNRFNDQQEFPE
jgi:alpha-D-ribose 1-methylphosphonate 5-triphosphate synthase subunit PhnH